MSSGSRRRRLRRWLAEDAIPVAEGSPRLRLALGAAVALAGLALYLATAARDLIAGDTPDFVIAAKVWGVPHAPGYPTVTILGHLFSWLPIGSAAFRVGLLAAVCHAATVAVVYATALRLTGRPWPSAAAGLSLASTPVFWKWSLQAETFPLNDLLAAAVVHLLLRWHQQPHRRAFLLGAVLLFGVGLTNQQTIILLAPAFVLAGFLHRKELRPRLVGTAAAALAVGLLPYVYVPIAASGNPALSWDDVHSVSAFVRLVTRQDYGTFALTKPTSHSAFGSYLGRLWYFSRATGVLLGPLAVTGAWFARRNSRAYLALAGVPFLLTTVGFLALAAVDPSVNFQLFVVERFFLLPLTLAAPFAAIGVSATADRLAARSRVPSARIATALVVSVAVVSGMLVAQSHRRLDVSDDRVATTYARDVLGGLKPNAILFVTGDEADLPLLYATTVLHLRPDVTVVLDGLFHAPWYQAQLRARRQLALPRGPLDMLGMIQANPSRPAAVIGELPDKSIDGKYYLYPNGLSYDLVRQSVDIGLDQAIADNTAKLAGYHLPNPHTIKRISFESVILRDYSNVAYNVGDQCRQLKQTSCAISWYQRALAIDPSARGGEISDRLRELGAG